MKIYILIILLSMFTQGLLPAQTPADQNYINQTKYWFYRSRLINEFCKVGPNAGESLPVGVINRNAHYLDIGDGSVQKLGHYLSILATEYKLLKMNNQSTTNTIRELYYALNAAKRLDEQAETNYFCYDLAALNAVDHVKNDYPAPAQCDGTGNSPNWNGFLLRTDIDTRNGLDAGVNGSTPPASDICKYFTNMSDVNHIGSDYGGNIKNFQSRARCDDGVTPSIVPDNLMIRNDVSHDQLNHLFMGMRVVQVMLDGSETYNPGTGTVNLKQFAINISTKIIDYMANGSDMDASVCAYLKNYLGIESGNPTDLRQFFLHALNNDNGLCTNTSNAFHKIATNNIPWFYKNPVLNQPACMVVGEGACFPYMHSYGYAKVGSLLTGNSYFVHPIALAAWQAYAMGTPKEAFRIGDAIKILTLVAITNSWDDLPLCPALPCSTTICFIHKPFSNNCWISKTIPLPGTVCSILGNCTPPKTILADQCKKGKFEILPLLNNVLYNTNGFGNETSYYETFFQDHINSAPCRGPYCLSPSDKAGNDWASWNMFVKPETRISGAYKYNNISGLWEIDFGVDIGEYNGMDYMLMYNLYTLYKRQSNSSYNPYYVNYDNNLTLDNRTIDGKSEYYNARGFRDLDGTTYVNGDLTTNTLTVTNNGYCNLRAGASITMNPGTLINPGSVSEATIYAPAHNWEWEMTVCSQMDVVGNDGIPDGHRKSLSQPTEKAEETITASLLGNCYPNPTDGTITIPYSIGTKASTEIYISDVFGKVVTTLVSKENHEKGQFTKEFNISHLPVGVYYYTLKTANYTETKKLMIVR